MDPLYKAAYDAEDQASAQVAKTAIINSILSENPGMSTEMADAIVKANIAYGSGNFGIEKRALIESHYGVPHPIFGPAALGDAGTFGALTMGRKIGEGKYRTGAYDMREGDRVRYMIDGRIGVAVEFTSDGDCYVIWPDDSRETVKWNNLELAWRPKFGGLPNGQ